ncbi:hypothetical protein HOD05_05380 [Candidatus Woesearchaeota archaeon]|nr:hypothetical protein [Candidatus Woesearchaeota archaeon]MBT4150518.1 hypothetical protein [Candidatus Woesearchaeota archaeon]MBT4247159.1 hypothetical protein [Candidatus Woesearchaeota archaeon]MBT4434616.1 hypothetical protein [Candidatus Woesearchaeota archaeon]MBT7332533.1 hypothetical protein [Candidatus Woesearchaeota archaeon]
MASKGQETDLKALAGLLKAKIMFPLIIKNNLTREAHIDQNFSQTN